MKYHEKTRKKGTRLARISGKSRAATPRRSRCSATRCTDARKEERFLIYQVNKALADKGIWNLVPRIGDLCAQQLKPLLKRFETIRDPKERPNVVGERPTNFLQSKYYKKRVKQLRLHIEKVRPFEPEAAGLVVVDTPLNLDEFSVLAEVKHEMTNDQPEDAAEVPPALSVVKATMTPARLFFRTAPGVTKSRSVTVTNQGTTAIYYKRECAREVELMMGAGRNRIPVQRDCSGK